MNLLHNLIVLSKSDKVYGLKIIKTEPESNIVYIFSTINNKPCFTLQSPQPYQKDYPWLILDVKYENNFWFFTVCMFFADNTKSKPQIWKTNKFFITKEISDIDFLMNNLGV